MFVGVPLSCVGKLLKQNGPDCPLNLLVARSFTIAEKIIGRILAWI
jgi:hypothetical protein